MLRWFFFSILLILSLACVAWGGFFRGFVIYDNLEKFDKLKESGIKIKVPGFQGGGGSFKVESQWFTEPELVRVMTFDGVGRYKDGRLISKEPDLMSLRGRRPCPT
ncbi:MAG: hypothetical protein AB1646_23700 [Thermodesulfobacteriota bacterium]